MFTNSFYVEYVCGKHVEGILLLGAIVGDIVGSRFEVYNHRSKDFDLFTDECRATDDSMMTIAIAKALLDTKRQMNEAEDSSNEYDYQLLEEMAIHSMQTIGRKYPDRGYGNMFSQWISNDNPEPYYSFGNGSAMRISPVAYAAKSKEELFRLSEAVTKVTHNHPEGLKGANATALAVYLARKQFSKEDIYNEISTNYYSLDFKIDEIRDTYRFNPTCFGTVPQAIVAFLESTTFEDAIRNAISIGGDSDTIAAITGSIAEAFYGIPIEIEEKALTYLDDYLLEIYEEWTTFMNEVTR